jgi:hypothetical protein
MFDPQVAKVASAAHRGDEPYIGQGAEPVRIRSEEAESWNIEKALSGD